MKIPIFCINLEKAEKRKIKFQREWIEDLGLDIEFWKATEATDERIKHINRKTKNLKRIMKYEEVALINSYVRLLEYIQKNNIEEAIIMEDDVFPNPIFKTINCSINFSEILYNYIKLCKKEFNDLDILLMHRVGSKYNFKVKKELEYSYIIHGVLYGAQMNYYTKAGIQKFYNNLKTYKYVIDHYHKMKNLLGHICLTKNYFAFHYDTTAIIRHTNYDSFIGKR
jgi:GR25 family glycosyltransferase involved in LPS biosynthesis